MTARIMLLLVVLAAVACGSDDSSKPNDALVLGSEDFTYDFETLEVRLATTATVATLQFVAFSDPEEFVVDDETEFTLTVAFDRAELATQAFPVTLTIDGTASFTLSAPGFDFEWTGSPSTVVAARLESFCFCTPFESGQHRVQGTVLLEAFDGDEIRGRLDLTFDGDIPVWGTGTLTAQAEFDVRS